MSAFRHVPEPTEQLSYLINIYSKVKTFSTVLGMYLLIYLFIQQIWTIWLLCANTMLDLCHALLKVKEQMLLNKYSRRWSFTDM